MRIVTGYEGTPVESSADMTPPPPAVESDAAEPRAGARALPGVGPRTRALDELLARPETAVLGVALAFAASLAVLLGRLVPDVASKPLFDDEVVAGLTAVHPLRELLDIVLFDRGGAPLHFLLAHVALAADPSIEALRWLSVVFAVATLPLCYDLGRRLSGRLAGSVAVLVAATSSMLAVYGTVGRMYALFAFVSALAVDLFVRALQKRTVRAAYVAAAAALLLPAVHPYGLVVVGIEAVVALVVWRGRPLKPALPMLLFAAALTPFVVADLRLGERFGVGASAQDTVAPPDFAAKQLGEALAAFAGGAGALALAFFALALVGLFVVFRRLPAFGAFALLALAAIPILMVVTKAQQELVHQLSPRHLMFGLPVWAALVGVGVARIVRDLPRIAAPLAVLAVALAAFLAPAGITDPRADSAATGDALAAPAAWTGERTADGSVLLFYSPVYLAGLADAERGIAIPRSGKPVAMAKRADYPVPSLVGALRLDGTRVDEARLMELLGPGSDVGVFPSWLTFSARGPYRSPLALLTASRDALVATRTATSARTLSFRRDLRGGLVTVCNALEELGEPCAPTVLKPARSR